MNTLSTTLRHWWSKNKGIWVPLTILAVLLGYDQGRKYWLDTQFADPAAVDTTLATVRERRHAKSGNLYEVEFRVRGHQFNARLHSDTTRLAVGEQVWVVYLQDDWEELRVLGE